MPTVLIMVIRLFLMLNSVVANHCLVDRRANLGFHLWGLLTLFLWMKRWGGRPPIAIHENREATAA